MSILRRIERLERDSTPGRPLAIIDASGLYVLTAAGPVLSPDVDPAKVTAIRRFSGQTTMRNFHGGIFGGINGDA